MSLDAPLSSAELKRIARERGVSVGDMTPPREASTPRRKRPATATTPRQAPEMPAEITLTLPWSCVLHDNHRFIPARGRLIASPKYRDTKKQAETLLRAYWRGPMLTGAVDLHARVFFPDHRRRDAGNYRKLITDALTGIAYGDDAQITRETWERAGVSRHNARVEITLTEGA